MNRRGFLASILALGAAPAIVRADSLMKIIPRSAEVLMPYEESIVIDQMRDLEFFEGLQWSEVDIDAMNVRAVARVNLATWFAERADQLMHDVLVLPDRAGEILLPPKSRIILPGEE